MADEVWACSACRSINKPKAKSCYKCRTPRDVAGVAPSEISLGANQAPVALALPTYRSTWALAMVASALVLAVAALRILALVSVAPLIQAIAAGGTPTTAEMTAVTNLGLLGLFIPLTALVIWAFWLSRVVTVMPALGLGYPHSTGLTSFVECLIPIYNFFRVPAILRDVTRRLAPNDARGNTLIAAAWIGLIGSFILERVGGVFIGLKATSTSQLIGDSLALSAICAALAVVGAGFLVYLTFWVEAGIRRIRGAQTADAAAAAPVAATVAATPVETAPAAESEPVATPFAPPAAEAPEPWTPTPTVPAAVAAVAAIDAEQDASEPEPVTHLRIRVHGETIEGTIDGDWEPITIGELTEAAVAIRDSGGSVTLSATDETLATGLGRDAFEAIRISGVRYTVDRS